MNKDIEIITIKALSDNYIWLLRNHSKKLTAVVDPAEAEPVEEILLKNNWELNQIINTHHHYDHTNGNFQLKKKYNAVLIAPKLEQDKIQNINHLVEDGDIIDIAGLPSNIIHTPGHTLGHICFFFEKEKIAFTGDTLFSLGCGKIFEGTHKQMLFSLNKIKKLPRETMIYCGHEYTYKNAEFCIKYDSNNINLKKKFEKIKKLRSQNLPTLPSVLMEELRSNIFLRCDQKELKIKLGMKNQEDLEVFKKVRDLKDSF